MIDRPVTSRRPRSGRKPKSPAFQFYAGDYLTDSRILAMSFEERGVWLHLICLAWLNGGLDPDTEVLARSCGMTARDFARVWKRVGLHFEPRGDRLVNPRQEREREFQAINRARRSDAGKKGNDARWSKDGARADADPASHCDRNAMPCASHLIAPVSRLPSPVALRTEESPSEIPPASGDAGAPKSPRAPRKPASGPQAELIRHFEAEWARTRPGVELVFRRREAVAAASLVKSPGLAEARVRVTRMLEDPSPWAVQNASLAVLDSNPNRWAVAPNGPRTTSGGARDPEPGSLQDLFGGGKRPRSIDTTGEVIHADAG